MNMFAFHQHAQQDERRLGLTCGALALVHAYSLQEAWYSLLSGQTHIVCAGRGLDFALTAKICLAALIGPC